MQNDKAGLLSHEQRKRFHAEGYIVLEGIIPQPLLAALRRECDAIVATVRVHCIPSHGCVFGRRYDCFGQSAAKLAHLEVFL